jgi:transposase
MAPTSLPDDVALLQEMVRQYQSTIEELQGRIGRLEHQLALLLRRTYGPRRERFDARQLSLFETEPGTEGENYRAHEADKLAASNRSTKRRGHGRRRLPESLRRQRIEHEMPPEELACPSCGRLRTKIGEEVSEQLEYKPASLFVVQHARFKYACRRCEENVTIAKKPPQPIEKGLAGPGLLAFTVVSKYGDHLSLYRLEEILSRHGVNLRRSTMCGWMRACAELLKPIYNLMVAEVLRSKVVHTDDTTVPVLDPSLPRTRTAQFWVYVGDVRHPYTVYDFTPTRSRDGPEKFLEPFSGYLQADAFAGYDRLLTGRNVIEVACWAHARRKFYDAKLTAPDLAHEALARIGQLYSIEREAKAKQLTSEERRQVRQARAVPLLEAIGQWLRTQRESVLPKSPIGQAVAYALSNWMALCRYPENGDLSIDNNVSERALRAQVVGRKNWLFAGSDNGGRFAAILFSFTTSCKHNGVDPYAYLADVLAQWPQDSENPSDYLPDRWLLRHPEARLELNRSA